MSEYDMSKLKGSELDAVNLYQADAASCCEKCWVWSRSAEAVTAFIHGFRAGYSYQTRRDVQKSKAHFGPEF